MYMQEQIQALDGHEAGKSTVMAHHDISPAPRRPKRVIKGANAGAAAKARAVVRASTGYERKAFAPDQAAAEWADSD